MIEGVRDDNISKWKSTETIFAVLNIQRRREESNAFLLGYRGSDDMLF